MPWGAVGTGISSSGISSWPQTWQSLSAQRGPHCQPIAPGKATSSQCHAQQHVGSFVGLLKSCQVWKNLIFSSNIQVQHLMLVLKSSLPITIRNHEEFLFQPGRSKASPHHVFLPQIRA